MKKRLMLTADEVANILDIPYLAVGQAIFDGKLTMIRLNQFSESEVLLLREREPAYLQSLR